MGIGALRRHRNRHEEPTPSATPSTEQKPASVTPEQLAELRKDPAFEAAYQEESRLAAEKEAAAEQPQ